MVIPISGREKAALTILIMLSLSLLSGCFDSSDDSSNGSVNGVWGNAPDFTLPTLDGETFTLSDHLGKVILIDLMAAWCYWCKPQMDELEAVLEEKGDEIVIVSVGITKSETSDDLRNTFGDYANKWTFVLDTYEEDVGSKYQVTAIPKLVIIDKQGNIYYSEAGLTSKEDLIELINQASE